MPAEVGDALLAVLLQEELLERASDPSTAESGAAPEEPAAPPAEEAAAADATAAAEEAPKGKRGAKKKKTLRSKGAAQDDDGGEAAGDGDAALATTQAWTAPTADGDSDSAGASSAGAASQKDKHKDKEEKEKVPVRQSARTAGEAAPEADIEKAKPRRKASGADTKASSAGGTGKLGALIAAATASGHASNVCGSAALTFYTSAYPAIGTSKPNSCFCNPTANVGM